LRVAYHLVHDGRYNQHYRKEKENVPVLLCEINGESVCVTRKQVSDYINDPQFLRILAIYNYTKLWGMPNGCGWANEPLDVLEGITALELEARKIEQEELENKRKHGNSGSKTEGGDFRHVGIPEGNKGHQS